MQGLSNPQSSTTRLINVKSCNGSEADKMSDYSVENPCAICLEEVAASISLKNYSKKCNHPFHESCLREWFESSNENNKCCPTCRSEITEVADIEANAKKKDFSLGAVMLMSKMLEENAPQYIGGFSEKVGNYIETQGPDVQLEIIPLKMLEFGISCFLENYQNSHPYY